VFSPSNKLFCFGQPNSDTLLNSYINGTTEFEAEIPVGRSDPYEEHNRRYKEATKLLEMEKKKLEDVKNLAKGCESRDWWNDPIDQMSIEQLQEFMNSINELRRNVAELYYAPLGMMKL